MLARVTGTLTNLALIVVFVTIGGFFSGSELAVLTLRESQVERLPGRRGSGCGGCGSTPAGSWPRCRSGEVAGRTGIALPPGPYETLGGFVVHSLGRIPVVGYAVPALGHVFTVVTMDGRRVARLRVAPAGEPAPQ